MVLSIGNRSKKHQKKEGHRELENLYKFICISIPFFCIGEMITITNFLKLLPLKLANGTKIFYQRFTVMSLFGDPRLDLKYKINVKI